MIPHLVTGTLPGGLVVQVEGASPGLIGSNPAVFFAEFSNHSSFPPPSRSPPRPFSAGLGTPLVNFRFTCGCHHRLYRWIKKLKTAREKLNEYYNNMLPRCCQGLQQVHATFLNNLARRDSAFFCLIHTCERSEPPHI